MLKKLLLTAAALAVAGPAIAAVQVIGNSSASMCFEAADSGSVSAMGMRYCDEALDIEALTQHDRVATFVNRGILKMRKGDFDEAVADFDTAIGENPKQAEAYLNKGVAMLPGPTAYAQAVPLFTRAIEMDTTRPEIAYLGRGMAHELNGDIKAAYFDYKKAQSIAPEWKEPAMELARFKIVRAN